MRYFAAAVICALLFVGCSPQMQSQMGVGDTQVLTEYDKFDDETTYTSAPRIAVRRGLSNQTMMDAVAICPGESVCQPERVYVRFIYDGEGWRYLDNHRVDLLADGQRIETITTERSGDVQSGGRVREMVITALHTDDYVALTEADIVEGRVGNTEFKLQPDDMDALQLLVTELGL